MYQEYAKDSKSNNKKTEQKTLCVCVYIYSFNNYIYFFIY